MSSTVGHVAILLALLALNGFFALAELALVSARPTRLRQLAAQGSKRAQAAARLAEHPSRFLSSVQVGITLIGIVSGAFGGTVLAEELGKWFTAQQWFGAFATEAAMVLVVGLVLLLSVLLGELVPKQLALHRPEGYALLAARPLAAFTWVVAPLVTALAATSKLLARLLGARGEDLDKLDDEEIALLVEEGVESGAFEQVEHDLVARALRLDDLSITAVMTPRIRVEWLDLEASPEQLREQVLASRLTFFPVGRGTLDELAGTVRAREVLGRLLEGKAPLAPELLHPPVLLPASQRALAALEAFKRTGEHLAFVVNEYGEVEGIVTSTDLLAALAGDTATHAPLITVREEGSWLVDGSATLEETSEVLERDFFPEEETDEYQTLAGFVLYRLGHIPVAGEYFLWRGLRFEVVDMDGSRIDKLLVEQEK